MAAITSLENETFEVLPELKTQYTTQAHAMVLSTHLHLHMLCQLQNEVQP